MTKIIDRLKLSVAAGILGDDPGRPLYVMEDRFAVPVGSGALNGTSADPGPSATRVVTDTASGAGVTLKYANIVFDGNSLTAGTSEYIRQLSHIPLKSWRFLPAIGSRGLDQYWAGRSTYRLVD